MAFKFKFLIGLCIFILGMAINIHSDKILLDIKRKKGYQIPMAVFINGYQAQTILEK
ncbi:MAG: hypothetical protein CM15mP4_1740 [Candidatus Neomarinimicrobiota bacterium]|nr:MAG: hypothetical protein CM15mP4_1740 [Candidatus Neomarinimicrobiota bacterium]